MTYVPHDFKDGDVLTATAMNEIEAGIVDVERECSHLLSTKHFYPGEVSDVVLQVSENLYCHSLRINSVEDEEISVQTPIRIENIITDSSSQMDATSLYDYLSTTTTGNYTQHLTCYGVLSEDSKSWMIPYIEVDFTQENIKTQAYCLG